MLRFAVTAENDEMLAFMLITHPRVARVRHHERSVYAARVDAPRARHERCDLRA